MLKTIRFKMVVLRGMGFLLFISCCIFATAEEEVDVADEPYFTDDFILVTEMRGRHIHQVSLDGRTVQLPIPSLNPMAATYDPYIHKVFWASQGDRRVMSSYLNGTEIRLIKKLTAAQSVEGIAIDPYEMFIFYTDGGANTINLVTYDGKKHLRIVMNAKNPRAIETDRKNKKIYWTDWGLETIETTDYDGANRRVVITRPGSWMNGLALDIKGNKMYWTDAKADRLEMADMDGTNLKTLLRHNETLEYKNGTAVVGQGEAHYFGVAVDEQNIYFSDWHRKGIYQISITTTGSAYEYTRLDQNLTKEVNGISIYQSSNYYQAPKSPCENHDCSDFCIPLKNDYRCACPDLHRFMPDSNRTCSPGIKANGPDVIWLEHDGYLSGWVRGVKGQPSVYLRAKSIRTWSIRSPAWHWTAVDLNYNDSLIYMYDKYDRYFVQLSLNGSLKIKIINHGSSSQVNGLAYDWLSHNLYWTDSLYNWIQVMNPGTNYTKTLIESSLDRPHGIAVYPQKGLMFWTDWGEKQKIQQANMDGTNVVELVNTLLNKPMGITIDYTNNKLFWTNTHVIESYDLVTKTRTQYGRRSQNTFMDVAVYKNFVFATDQGVSLTIGRSRSQLWFFDLKDVGGRGMRLPLSRKPYGITMYAASRQKQDTTAPCSVNPCHHLCVPVPSSYGVKRQCLCQDGYKTSNNGRTCLRTLTSKGAMYVYALYDRICAMPFKSTMKKTLKEDANTFCFFNSTKKQYRFRAVDFNYNEGEIYFSESGSSVKTIRRARLEQKGVNSVLVYGTGDVRGLAVDWMTSNMYWTDAEANAIWVSRLEGQYMRKLITDVHNPGAIALDMQTKRLFWTESLGNLNRIMVARLDGTHQTTFVRNTSVISNSTFTSLAVDYVAQRIYWVNPSRNQIWSASLINGSEHRIQALGPRSGKIYGVTVMQDFVGFTEKSSHSSIHVVEKESGKEVNRRGIRHLNQTTVYDIVAYYSGNQHLYLGNANSSCNVANGGCKQLCFPMSSGHKCGCTDSMKVSRDGVSCEPSTKPLKDKFFLIADDYRHQIYQSDENLENIRALKFPPVDRPIGLTYDFVSDRVFWTDFHSHVVKSMYLNGSYVKLLFGEGARSRTEGLAFDPASQLLYYTDSVRSTIAVMNPSGRYHKVLVKFISSPRAIVLDPANGYMYVTSRKTNRGRIIRYQMDGKNETALVASGLSRPNGLDIDFKNKKMYWCDADTELVGSADIDGNNSRRMFKAHDKADPFDVAVHGDYIYWTDWALKGLFRVSLADHSLTKLRTDLFSGLNDIKYFSRVDRNVSTACSVNNGHCSHFCIPLPGNIRTCECPDRFGRQTQAADGKNCPGVTACQRIENVDDTCNLRRGVVCGVKCPNDYHPTVQNITCLNSGVWNADVNRLCAENKKCPLLQIPRNVNIHCPASRTRGDVCTYTCFANSTYVSGDRNRTCNDSFFWTGKPLICKTKMCPDGIDNGQFYARCFRYVGKTCQYTCNPTYKKISNDPVMCQMNETWSSDVKKLCQKKVCPAVISNGKFEDSCHHYVGEQCQYSCNPGYKKTSSVILKCQMNQTWSTDVKTLCERKTCPDGITNGTFADNCKRYAGNECQYSCNAGYKKTSDVTLKCQMNQTWNAEVKTLCEQLTCSVLPVPKNSKLTCKQPVHIGDECSFTCKPDTDYVSGSLQRKCMIDLSWLGTPIVCKSRCKPLATPKNTKVQPAACNQTLQKINTVCSFSCVDGSGYVSGNNTRTCLSSLAWSGDPLVCAVSGSGHTAKATGHHGGNVGVTVAIVIIVLLIIAVVVVGLFFVWRRHQHKTRTEYRESSPNSNDTTRYDVGHGSVNLDGSVAFDNPVYGTLPGSQPEGATIAAGDVGIEVVTTPEQTACENPLFDLKDNATTDKKVLLDDIGSSNHDTAA